MTALTQALSARVRQRRQRASRMSRAQRQRVSPKEPRRATVAYMQAMDGLIKDFQGLAEEILFSDVDPLAEDQVIKAVGRVRQDTDSVRFGALELAISELTSEKNVGRILRAIAQEIHNHSRGEMARVLGIDIASNAALNEWIQGFIRENVSLIRSVGFEQLDRMRDLVETSVTAQVSTRDLSKALRLSFDFAKSRADLIARDQTLKANADLNQARQQQVGVTEYIWTTSGDERVRSGHARLDGTRQSWLNPPIVDPSGRRAHPGKDFQCRCTATPIVDHLLED